MNDITLEDNFKMPLEATPRNLEILSNITFRGLIPDKSVIREILDKAVDKYTSYPDTFNWLTDFENEFLEFIGKAIDWSDESPFKAYFYMDKDSAYKCIRLYCTSAMSSFEIKKHVITGRVYAVCRIGKERTELNGKPIITEDILNKYLEECCEKIRTELSNKVREAAIALKQDNIL